MLRLSLAARVTMIVLIGLMIVWIGTITLYYWAEDLDGEGGRPSARQIAAITQQIERAPASERPLILESVASSILAARLESVQGTGTTPTVNRPVDETLRQVYAAALDERPMTISVQQRPLPRIFASATDALEFRIPLRTGETLVINTKSRLVVSRLGLPAGFGAGLFGTLIALLALIIMYRQMRPVVQIAAAVDRIDPEGQPIQLPTPRIGAPELHALVQAFNRLQTRLAHLLHARMAMLGGISHDVRTFATRLRLRADQIPDEIERERAIGDISDMIRLLDDALLISRAGAGELAEELVEFDAIVRSEIEDRHAAGAAIHFRADPDPTNWTVLGDRLALRRVVSNVMDNALKYGHVAHGSIETDGQSIAFVVDDEGTGIPTELREMMLEPFVRLEGSRNRATGGAGLGLAVVRSLVQAHGGSIVVGDAPTGGARFVVTLPLFKAA